MNTEHLNRRLRYFAERGISYDDKVWHALWEAWEAGYECGRVDESEGIRPGDEEQANNPFPVRSDDPLPRLTRAR